MARTSEIPSINRPLYLIVKFILWIVFFRIMSRVKVSGIENVPKEGGVLLYTNHLSAMDIPVLFISIPRFLYVFAAEKYREHWWGTIMSIAGAIFIKRGEVDRKALGVGLEALKQDQLLVIAIEGTRSLTAELQEGKGGAAYLANRADVPAIPVAMTGTQDMLSSAKKFKRAQVTVHFGEPIHLPPGRARTEQLDQYTDDLMVELASMLPEAYRGVYSDHPEVREPVPLPTGGY